MNEESDLFNSESDELDGILIRSIQFCQKYGYNELRIEVDEGNQQYESRAIAKSNNQEYKSSRIIPKPRRVTLEEIEKKFGCPVEIVP